MKPVLLALLLLAPGFAAAADRLKPAGEAEGPLSLDRDRGAFLMEWQHPEYPAALRATKTTATVRVRYIVDETGAITSPEAIDGDERFHAAAVAAVRQWKYRPEMRDARPVAVSLEAQVPFSPAGPPRSSSKLMAPYVVKHSPTRPPSERRTPDPVYPKFLEFRRLTGSVELVLGVNEQGRVDGVEILRSSHPDFLGAALETVAGWEFEPARSGRLPLPGRKQAVLQFSVIDGETGLETKVDWLERNGIFLREPPATKTQGYFDVSPVAVAMVDPVYPHELRQTGTAGGARVNFSVDSRGLVTNVAVAEATNPECGAAVAAAIAAWRFQPLRRNGEITIADFSFTWKFAAPGADSADQRLLAGLARGEKATNPRELDRPLRPLFLRAPVYPAAFADSGLQGEADIDVMIDREGRVRLPRIAAASKPEFGWAAATAVSQWFFETPRKNGQAVEVRVIIPVEFKPQ